jgi:hypothetical protein
MNMRKITMVLAMAVLAAATGAWAQDVAAFDARYNAVLSKLQSMGHGYIPRRNGRTSTARCRIW